MGGAGTGRSRERKEKGEKLLYVAGGCGSLALSPASGLQPLPRPGPVSLYPTLKPWGHWAGALTGAGREPEPGVIKWGQRRPVQAQSWDCLEKGHRGEWEVGRRKAYGGSGSDGAAGLGSQGRGLVPATARGLGAGPRHKGERDRKHAPNTRRG